MLALLRIVVRKGAASIQLCTTGTQINHLLFFFSLDGKYRYIEKGSFGKED